MPIILVLSFFAALLIQPTAMQQAADLVNAREVLGASLSNELTNLAIHKALSRVLAPVQSVETN